MTPNRFRPAQPAAANFSLKTYRLRALAVASAAVLAQKAEAQLVTVLINKTISSTGDFYFNPIDGATGLVTGPLRFHFCAGATWLNTYNASTYYIAPGVLVGATIPVMGPGYCLFSYSGNSIGPGLATNYNISSYDLATNQTYFGGFKMVNQGAGFDTYYGWIEVSLAPGSVTLVRSVYNPIHDEPINLGVGAAIPEPAHAVSLLAAGAAGIALFRRRRREKAAVVAA